MAKGREAARKQSFYRGVTSRGEAIIHATSGGHVDTSGHYVPESFPPDPYHLSNPVSAMAHYIAGSGNSRNYYLQSVDTSHLRIADFKRVKQVLDWKKPGRYYFKDVPAENFDSGLPRSLFKFSSAATIGRLSMKLNGSLVVQKNGKYSFSGYLGSEHDFYNFDNLKGRTKVGEFSTSVGQHLLGKDFKIFIIGTRPFSEMGSIKIRAQK